MNRRQGLVEVADIERAISSHALWMSQLREAILAAELTDAASDAEAVRAVDRCDFGKWLLGPGLSEEDRAGSDYRDVQRLHADFHQVAAHVVELAASGKTREAYDLLYGEYITVSGRLAIAMRSWQNRLLAGQ